jgi:hypothetical protein
MKPKKTSQSRTMFKTPCRVAAWKRLAVAVATVLLSAGAAQAGATYTFTTSTGVQPSNVGTITLTQVNSTTVNLLVDLIDTTLPLPSYGFLNTGGPHTPFAFTLAGTESGVSATFTQPSGGLYAFGLFSLSTANGDDTPYGTFGVTINSTAGNGSSNAYYGDLEFQITRTSGLSTDDFITNSAFGGNAYFAADLTDGGSNTGAQAWTSRTTTTVPENGGTIFLLALGLAPLLARRVRNRASLG